MCNTQLHIQVFGPITVNHGGKVLRALRSQPTVRLLACLACRPHRSFTREELVETLWPNCDPTAGRNRLNVSLSSLRKSLGLPVFLPLSEIGKQHVRINAQIVTTDYAQFQALLGGVGHESTTDSQISTYMSALDLYKGELAPELDDEWTLGERQSANDQFLSATGRLTRLLIGSGRHDEALNYLMHAIRVEPFREDMRRLRLQILCAIGRRSEAVTEYNDFVELLGREMGIAPSEKTIEIISRLLRTEPLAAETNRKINKDPSPARQEEEHVHSSTGQIICRGPLFGRDDAVLDVSSLLRSSSARLVSLTGIGGIGKTRLAHAVSEALADQFGSARYHVSLADVADPRYLEQAIVRSLNIRSDARMNAHSQIIAALKDKPVLLILDNLEQLLPAAASIVRLLLDDLPEVKFLATSRQRLNLSLEHEYVVLPLPTPALSGTPHRLLEFPSMQLFMHRAEIVSPGFEMSEQNSSDLAAICHQPEGIPLATEMAASWLRVLTPSEILSRLSPMLPMLVSREVDSPRRHISVRHTLDCSYDQLSPSLKRAFARLSVFRCGWTTAAAECVAGSVTTASDLMDLRDRSLVSMMYYAQPLRLHYLDIVREYAGERLAESGEEAEARISHAQFYLDLVDVTQRQYINSDSVYGLDVVDSEYRNISEALRWSLNGSSHAQGARLAASMWRYWLRRGYISEGIEWLDLADSLATDMPESLRASIKLGAGSLRTTAGDYAPARVLIDDALVIVQGSEVQSSDDQSLEAEVQNALGNLAFVSGDWAGAKTEYEHALHGHMRAHNASGEARVLSNLANVAVRSGDLDAAIGQFDCALHILRVGADSHTLASVMANSVSPLLAGNNLEAAAHRLVECIQLSLQAGFPRVLAHCFEGTAAIAMRQSRWGDSVVMFSVAAAIRSRINSPLPLSHRNSYAADYAFLRQCLGDAGFDKAWKIGSDMSDAAAAEFCIEGIRVASVQQSTLRPHSRSL